jgi:hypothetical protein
MFRDLWKRRWGGSREDSELGGLNLDEPSEKGATFGVKGVCFPLENKTVSFTGGLIL